MAESFKKNVSEADKAKAFIEFEYTEVKDLSKQFLTVVTAVFALSVSFPEKGPKVASLYFAAIWL